MDENQPDPMRLMTLEEVNQLVPAMESHIQELHRLRDELSRKEVEIDALELVADPKKRKAKVLDEKLDDYNRSVAHFYEVVDEIQRKGGLLKDLDLGLVDFYTRHEGRVVYLCWRLGEKEIKFWHEIGRGYRDRQPL